MSPTTSIRFRPYHRLISNDSLLFSSRADERLKAARGVGRREKRALAELVRDWPPHSPAAINAWLLFVTTKPPAWRDTFVLWNDQPPTLGFANEGFYYPDPLGFWTEIRRWSSELFHLQQPDWPQSDTLALTSLVHVGDDPTSLKRSLDVCAPQVVLFLDDPSWQLSSIQVTPVTHYISDPHRKGQVYEGFWGRTAEGRVVGKSPQHPTTHNLYRDQDMIAFLRSAPLNEPVPRAG